MLCGYDKMQRSVLTVFFLNVHKIITYFYNLMEDKLNASLYVLITSYLKFRRGRRVSGAQQIRHKMAYLLSTRDFVYYFEV